jgi:outer membrane cobalamin receptor
MRTCSKLAAATTLVIVVTACASGGSSNSGARRGQRDVIALEEIQASDANNAYDLIRLLRPEMLRPRSGMGSTTNIPLPVVYIDGVRPGDGGVTQLQSIPRDIVREIRYINSADATTRFGTGHMAGAIMVSTRRGGGTP